MNRKGATAKHLTMGDGSEFLVGRTDGTMQRLTSTKPQKCVRPILQKPPLLFPLLQEGVRGRTSPLPRWERARVRVTGLTRGFIHPSSNPRHKVHENRTRPSLLHIRLRNSNPVRIDTRSRRIVNHRKFDSIRSQLRRHLNRNRTIQLP